MSVLIIMKHDFLKLKLSNIMTREYHNSATVTVAKGKAKPHRTSTNDTKQVYGDIVQPKVLVITRYCIKTPETHYSRRCKVI